ncbi:MAG: MOSC domain-containing protein [Cyanobacteria bacterium]|nr:MOSC domain-containing protein [Cyanobacteriota bacterium]MDA0865284.1 MOSC domain-containing protein [Cyanobacteriota bacterium]
MPAVVAVNTNSEHQFSKTPVAEIMLIEGQGIEGDAHCGETVQHRSRVNVDATQPNLRQVHLIHLELIQALQAQGFRVDPGSMGENITTVEIDLLSLPRGTVLKVGPEAAIKVTGLRNPCLQLDAFQPGLLSAVLDRDSAGNMVRKAGIMAVVMRGGRIRPGDSIEMLLPKPPYKKLERV